MECRNIQKDLIFYLDRELPEERMAFIARHLDECPLCSGFLEELKMNMAVIETERKTEASPYFFTRLLARLDEQPELQEQTVWNRVVQPAFFTLLLLAAVYGGLRVGYHASAPVVQPQQNTIMPGMDDFGDEPIETFLLDKL